MALATRFVNSGLLTLSASCTVTIPRFRAIQASSVSRLIGKFSTRSYRRSPGSFAAQASTLNGDDPVFQQSAAAELAGFDSSLFGIKTILDQLGAEKGLMNYDRTNDLETLLKNVINLNKDTLSAVDDLVYKLPVLGPILGPSEFPCSDRHEYLLTSLTHSCLRN